MTQNPSEVALISVILPTFEREQVLRNTLEYLLHQDYPNLEVILVDQSSQHDKATAGFIHEMARAGHLRHIRLSSPSVTAARNVGIEQAKGEIVLFCDDDVIVGPDWAACHARNYADPIVGGVAGQVLEPGEVPEDARRIGRISWCGRLVLNFNSTRRMDVDYVKGGNMSFRRTVALQAGLFDTRFTRPALLEDVDFAYRVRRLGYRIAFDPEASVKHLAHPTGGQGTRTYDRVTYYYHLLRSKTLFMLKHASRWEVPCWLLAFWARAAYTGLLEARSCSAAYRLGVQAIWDGYRFFRQA